MDVFVIPSLNNSQYIMSLIHKFPFNYLCMDMTVSGTPQPPSHQIDYGMVHKYFTTGSDSFYENRDKPNCKPHPYPTLKCFMSIIVTCGGWYVRKKKYRELFWQGKKTIQYNWWWYKFVTTPCVIFNLVLGNYWKTGAWRGWL